MTDPQDLKQRWHEANAVVEAIDSEREKLLAPTERRWLAALDAMEKLDNACDSHGAVRCVSCAGPIFAGDLYFGTDELFCLPCAPKHQDLLDEPEFFVTADGDQATPEQCRQWFDEHIARGGAATDSMADRRFDEGIAHG